MYRRQLDNLKTTIAVATDTANTTTITSKLVTMAAGSQWHYIREQQEDGDRSEA